MCPTPRNRRPRYSCCKALCPDVCQIHFRPARARGTGTDKHVAFPQFLPRSATHCHPDPPVYTVTLPQSFGSIERGSWQYILPQRDAIQKHTDPAAAEALRDSLSAAGRRITVPSSSSLWGSRPSAWPQQKELPLRYAADRRS
jgi:hypothetical protein